MFLMPHTVSPAPTPPAPTVADACDPALALADLQSLRDELDGIDWRLLESLRQRLECCVRIGLHKREHAIDMMQPHRIGIVQQRAAEFATNHGISRRFVHALYVLIIEETCRLELEVMQESAGA